jgi:hypothetical protein
MPAWLLPEQDVLLVAAGAVPVWLRPVSEAPPLVVAAEGALA